MTPPDPEPPITVAECTPERLNALEAAMPSPHHTERYAVQLEGDAVYLIAAFGARPAGHVLLRWAPTMQIRARTGSAEPCIEALGVDPPLQSRGIGTALVRVCEDAARARGCATIGLAVGVENPRARALYERLGYGDIGVAPFEVTWNHTDSDGSVRPASETCVYMRKLLAPP